jgi:hypothetical protein
MTSAVPVIGKILGVPWRWEYRWENSDWLVVDLPYPSEK